MEYFLGIDIGTGSCKAIAFSPTGETLAQHAVFYEIRHPLPDRSEQDPAVIYAAFLNSVENVLQQMGSLPPRFCAFSAAMHSLILVDERGEPISPSIIWADNRAAAVAERLHAENKA